MAFQCPSCSRQLADASDPSDPPQFCMYCGYRLRGSTPAPTALHEPELSDSRTSAFVARPADNEATTKTYPEASQAPEATPSVVGGFQLVRLLGSGGMGQVYEAVHPGNGQRVAIKLLSRRLAASTSSVERFRQEGRVASQISHPHCVFVLRADTDAGRPYIMMELMPGRTLKDIIDDDGPMKVPEAIGRILDVIDGLTQAHELGVIHRDVKPSNCFLTADNRVKVGDFGLSKSLATEQPNQQLTHSGAFLGTVLFASPEQIRGEPVSYDSDVYAVCATMYFLLIGRAPFQHESLTASLAKAVSEPPPPIRPKRPDVPAELEKIILKGLDRDRQKRWATLDELRHALEDVRPERQQAARPRSLIMAYTIDCAVIGFAGLPLEIAHGLLMGDDLTGLHITFTWMTLILGILYFTLFEGILGWTLGKRLLRLRVSRVGETGPPGLIPAAIRSLVFNFMWLMLTTMPEWFVDHWPRGVAGGFAAVGSFMLGTILLLLQLKHSTYGWRGVHDRLSGCRVTSRNFNNPPVSLESLYEASIWDRVQPSPTPLPAQLGSFTINHKLADLDDGGMVWHAEDRSLGRRVLLHILPIGQDDPIRGEAPMVRSHRLRIIGHGMTVWDGSPRAWVAYVAPAGVPLADCVSQAKPLSWITTRSLLEQLTLELESSQQEGQLPGPLSIDQVWVEPNGRLQLLDFPLPGLAPEQKVKSDSSPHSLIRQVASLALEGRARNDVAPIAAPIPFHASRLTKEFFEEDLDLAKVRHKLSDDHQQPGMVTTGMRAGHLAVQGSMMAIGLSLMLFMSGGLALTMALSSTEMARQPIVISAVLKNPAELAALQTKILDSKLKKQDKAALLDRLSPTELNKSMAIIEDRVSEGKKDFEIFERSLIAPERKLLSSISRVRAELGPAEAADVNLRMLELYLLRDKSQLPFADLNRFREMMGRSVTAFVITWPVIWIFFALIFRGGLSFYFAGLALVRRNGRPLGRLWCALREFLVLTPLTLGTLLTIWIQVLQPLMAQTRAIVWLLTLLLLPVYVVIALRLPSRPPQDRLFGSYIVPR
jgi:eukaryotic-like serine/threonine-protein kinase